MYIQRKNGALSNIIRVMLRNSSTGQGLTGLSSASSGLIISTICDNEAAATTYSVAGSTIESITTLGTFAAPTASKCRFKEVDATNHPGLYEIQLADARFAVASAKTLRISVLGAASLLALSVVCQLTAYDPDDATSLGVSRLDAAVSTRSTLTAAGVWDALLTGITTAGSVGKLIKDYLDAAVSSRSTLTAIGVWDVATSGLTAAGSIGKFIMDNWTAARAALLDKLNITGNVASSAEVTSIQNNTRTVITTPEVIERPDSGTMSYIVRLYLYDEVGNMEAPDSTPTVTLINQSGTDLSARLSAATNPSTGVYQWTYTASVGDALDQLRWEFSVIEGGLTRLFGRQSLIVDTTAADFTSADRVKLNALHDDRLTADRASKLDNLDVAVSTRSTLTAAEVWANATRTLSSFGTLVSDTTTAVWAAIPANLSNMAARFLTMIGLDGAVYQYTANALELAPAGGGGGGSTSVVIKRQLTARIAAGGGSLSLMVGDDFTLYVQVLGEDGEIAPLTGYTVTALVTSAAGTTVDEPACSTASEALGLVSVAIDSGLTASAQRDLSLTLKLDGGAGNTHITAPLDVTVNAR